MATLIHEELESISGQARQMVSLQQRGIEATEAGFNQINDAVGHLAWVQQRAHEEQLTAQYRVMQLQADTIGELGRANETLAVMSVQLAEVAEILREIKGTQDEHLQIVKAERTLKEVLFQLTTMLEDMIEPDDAVARLALCQVALDQLDHYGLGTSALSDLDDKRAFSNFVKNTRKYIRDTDEETQSDLLAIETWHKRYSDSRALWQSGNAPLYVPRPAPKWIDGVEPPFSPKMARPSPEARKNPGDHPLPKQFGKMPGDIFIDGQLKPYPFQEVAPGTFTPDNVPSGAETRARLPDKRRGLLQLLDSLFSSEEWANARKFEQALRSWAGSVRAYNKYVKDLAKWQNEAAEVEKENEATLERHAAEVAVFREKEAERRQRHEEACEKYREEDLKSLEEWKQSTNVFVKAFNLQGRTINAFLEEHPDMELVYSKVNVEKDVAAIRQRIEQAASKKSG